MQTVSAKIISPGQHGTISFESQTVLAAGRNRDDVCGLRWNLTLTKAIVAPRHDCSIRPQSKAMPRGSGKCDEVIGFGSKRYPPVVIGNPRRHGVVVAYR